MVYFSWVSWLAWGKENVEVAELWGQAGKPDDGSGGGRWPFVVWERNLIPSISIATCRGGASGRRTPTSWSSFPAPANPHLLSLIVCWQHHLHACTCYPRARPVALLVTSCDTGVSGSHSSVLSLWLPNWSWGGQGNFSPFHMSFSSASAGKGVPGVVRG